MNDGFTSFSMTAMGGCLSPAHPRGLLPPAVDIAKPADRSVAVATSHDRTRITDTQANCSHSLTSNFWQSNGWY